MPGLQKPGGLDHRGGLDIDQYAFGVTTPAYRYPHCRAVLDRVTPLVAFGPGWYWELNRPWLAERLRRYLTGLSQVVPGAAEPTVARRAAAAGRVVRRRAPDRVTRPAVVLHHPGGTVPPGFFPFHHREGGVMAADRPHPDWPLVVAYGLGVNRTAMLVEFVKRKIRPDLVLFADTGGEKPETYAYLPVIQDYLKEVKFPPVVTMRYEPKTAPYRTLEGQCLRTGTLPSLAYGGRTCSQKWKRQPQDAYILRCFPPGEVEGRRVMRAIGFDASEGCRTYAGVVKAVGLDAG